MSQEKSLPPRDEDYLPRRDEQWSSLRGPPFSQRDSRVRHSDLDPYPDKPKMVDKNADPPSEVLWIGFPALLKVDEVILRKAFHHLVKLRRLPPFQVVVMLLFVSKTWRVWLIQHWKELYECPFLPRLKSYGRTGSSEIFLHERDFGSFSGDSTMRSPPYISSLEPEDPDILAFSHKGNLFEQRRFQEPDAELGLPESMYRRVSSRDRDAHFRDFSPEFPRKDSSYDDSWDLPEDVLLFHGAKKIKTGYFPPDNELPEYPLSGSDQARHPFPKTFHDIPPTEVLDKNFESRPFGYKQIPDHALSQPYGERIERRNPSYDSFQGHSGSLPSLPVERRRPTPESHQPSLTGEWKWEGTIAKGGTSICRARCFPVGKVLDMTLPEFLDCTARTSLDMLAKHYYQAASAWVVFFVPESDADIGYYNEFMHYLEEKQRAAVAKLDDKTTLFLVPPSEFSEKVLKVPGKLSISGVVLRLEHTGSNLESALQQPQADMPYTKSTSPSGPFPPVLAFSNTGKSGVSPASISGSPHAPGSMSGPTNENRNEMLRHLSPPFGPNWSPHHPQNSNLGARNIVSQASYKADDSATRDITQSCPELCRKLVQVVTALEFQSGSAGGVPGLSTAEEFRPSNAMNYSENSLRAPQKYPEASSSQFGLGQPASSLPVLPQQMPTSVMQEEDADPQKRLQATLQLAAALLQQIQQGKGS
ncbi:unnamed protein product [Thlaspi arvense]|uniref:Spen paralogue and orthologue SPOC C-terminal domain-containing protein n=1 Tax=Thlaspi arvense TaxID=13288 RepID=A0AAU9SMK1_THLAR|nr:unnamed protein product [Thlaspi arvense]